MSREPNRKSSVQFNIDQLRSIIDKLPEEQ